MLKPKAFTDMQRGAPEAPGRSPQALFTDSPGNLPNAVAGPAAELLPSNQEQSPVNGASTRDVASVRASKRPLDEASEDALPTKKARLTQVGGQQPPFLQQPKPTTPNGSYASFLKEFVEPPPTTESVSTLVTEWLKSVGSDRDSRCRSDSHLQRLGDDPVPRSGTKSAPEMGYTRDADGFAVPPTPAFTSRAASVLTSDLTESVPDSTRSSARSLVEDPLYRDLNLAANNIYMRHPCDPIPEHVASLVDCIRQDRTSPAPLPDEVRGDRDLYDLSMGAGEPDVEQYFHSHIFPGPQSSDPLKRTDETPMAKHTVPSTGTKLKVSTPVPDMLYGYNRRAALPDQQTQLISMGSQPVANNVGLLYPFFVVEFKGDGGSLWVATNQCLGGSASCVKMAEDLNRQLRQCKSGEVEAIDSASFSIAMNGTEARLYVSWKENELEYYMANVKSFLLQDAEHYIEFRKYVRNIVDWGRDKRLKDIRKSLDSLLEESRKRSSEAAKSRQPPFDVYAGSSSKKPKPSTSRKSSKSHSTKGQDHRAQVSLCETEARSIHHGESSPYLGHQQSFVDTTTHTVSRAVDNWAAVPNYLYLQQNQEGQSQQTVSLESTVEVAACFATRFDATSAPSSSAHGNYAAGPMPSSASQEPSVTCNYSEQHIPAGDQRRFSTVGFPAQTAFAPSAEEQALVGTENHWTPSRRHEDWYHLTDDGPVESAHPSGLT